MTYLNDEELKYIIGGINITGSILASIVRGINAIMDVGRSLGTAIRRSRTNNICPL